MGDSIQFRLDDHHVGADTSTPQRGSGVGGHIVLNGCVGNDFYIAVVAFKNLGGVIALLSKVLTSPLAQPLTGHRGAIAKFGRQRLHKIGPAQIGIEQFVYQTGDIGEKAPTFYEKLVISRGAGNVKIIAAAPIKLRVNSIQRKGNNGQNVGPQGAFFPGRVYFTGSHIFDVVRKADGHIFRVTAGRSQMDRDPLGYKRRNCRHRTSYRFCGGVL